MYKALIPFILLFSLHSWAQPKPKPIIHKFEGVVINTCDDKMTGCVPTIEIDGKSLVVDIATVPESMKDMLFAKDAKPIFLKNMEAIIVSEEGHGPNPMLKQPVLKIIVADKSANIELCRNGIVGCAPRINVKGESVLLDFETLPNWVVIESQGSLNVSVEVKGYFASEKGHFPNPTVYFKVFKIVEVKINKNKKGDQLNNDLSRGKLNSKQSNEQAKPTNKGINIIKD
jgi:hypothetical protein